MSADELVKLGQVDEALAALKEEVKKKPADARLRVFLFQLLVVNGDWERAMTQLNVAADLDPVNLLMAQVCRAALQAEAFRREVYAGERSAVVFGEPEEWMGWLVQANALFGKGKFEAAAELRDKAFEAAPAARGSVNGEAFEWAADMDGRMGPVLEGMVDGRYYWIPMGRIRELNVEAPKDLRDVVWAPAQFRWTTGGENVGLVFARYPGSERSADPLVRLGRKTEWTDHPGGISTGLGQRMLATDAGEYAVLDVRSMRTGEEASGG